MTLKTILDNVMLESGMDTETVYVTSSKDEVKRMVNLANRAAQMIAVSHDWQGLRKTHTFTLTEETQYDLPEGYRSIVPDSTFTDSNLTGVDMHPTPTEWRYLQVNNSGSGAQYRMRVINDKLHVFEPVLNDTVSFEYISEYPVTNTAGTAKKKFTADTDSWLLDVDLLEMAIIWRYKKLLGLADWQIDLQEFTNYARTVKGNDTPAKTIGVEDNGNYGEPYTSLWVNS